MNGFELWVMGKRAAEVLSGLEGARILLSIGLSSEDIKQFSAASGARIEAFISWEDGRQPRVLEYVDVVHEGIEVSVTGTRAATAADVANLSATKFHKTTKPDRVEILTAISGGGR
jgi:hypothetical protein